MNKIYEPLFQPWKVGNLEIKNRFVLCPMEGTNILENLRETGVNKRAYDFYINRAKDGIGLMVAGAVPMVSIVRGRWLYQHPEFFDEAKPWIDEIHSYGSKVLFQLNCGLGRSFPIAPKLADIYKNPVKRTLMGGMINYKDYMITPDEGEPNVWDTSCKHHQMTKAQIQKFVYAMGQSALLCKKIGVDGVEVHAVHEGYLLDQFTMPYTNHRTDEYGGSLENRYRFAVEIVREIKRVCGEDYPVALRYSVTSKTKGFNQGALPGEEYVEVGRDYEESKWAIQHLRKAGYDMFDCDNGTYDAWYWPHPPVYMPLNTNLDDVAYIKQFTDAPVVCAGRMQAETAAQAIADGRIDAMGLARQFLCDEQFITKIREGRLDEIRPCISCHAACLPIGSYGDGSGAIYDTGNLTTGQCALNPLTFNEKKFAVKKAVKPKHIAVVGGGIGGMEAAIQLSKRGHRVDLYEQADHLGGVFVAAAAPDFKEKDKELLAWYERELQKSGAVVHLNAKISSLQELKADEYVIATGAKPRHLNIPGGENTTTATDYLLRKVSVGESVAVIGGGLTGCEIAYELALAGKKPIVVEMMDALMKAPGISAANTNMLRDEMKRHKVPVYLQSKTLAFEDGVLSIEAPDGIQKVKVDNVITSIGYTPDAPLSDVQNEHVHVIGDANKVANLRAAIWDANELALKLSCE